MLEAWVGEGGTGKTGAGPGWDWTSERDEIYTVTVMDRAEGKAGFQRLGRKLDGTELGSGPETTPRVAAATVRESCP